MTAVAFKQAHEYDGKHSGIYEVPNENIKRWYDLFESLEVSRAAAICSSGEIGLITILPRVQDELLLFDHAPVSLHIAMTKCLIAKEVGIEKMHELICGRHSTELEQLAAGVKLGLPSEIRGAYGKAVPRYTDDYCTPGSTDHCYLETSSAGYRDSTYILQDYWKHIPLEWAKAGFEKLELVRFLHGTFDDLETEEPFDLLYISNAQEYGSRNNTRLHNAQLRKLVKPGGYVAIAHSHYNGEAQLREGFKLAAENGDRDYLHSIGGCWKHELWQAPE